MKCGWMDGWMDGWTGMYSLLPMCGVGSGSRALQQPQHTQTQSVGMVTYIRVRPSPNDNNSVTTAAGGSCCTTVIGLCWVRVTRVTTPHTGYPSLLPTVVGSISVYGTAVGVISCVYVLTNQHSKKDRCQD